MARARLVGGMVAIAAAFAPATAQAERGLYIGPIRVHHSYQLRIAVVGCSGRQTLGLLNFLKRLRHASESHALFASKADCRAGSGLSSATLSARFGRFGHLRMTFGASGRPWQRVDGCQRTVYQPGTVTGTMRVTIDPWFFGRVSRVQVPATFERFSVRGPCPSDRHEVTVFGFVNDSLSFAASQSGHGRRRLEVDYFPGCRSRRPCFLDQLLFRGGSSLFDVGSSLNSATIHAHGRLASGSLSFTRDPACANNPSSGDGAITGRLKLHFDLAGTVVVRQAQGYISRGGSSSCGNFPGLGSELRRRDRAGAAHVSELKLGSPSVWSQ